MNFWIISDNNDGAVLDSYPQGGPEGWRYLRSHRLSSEFPKDAFMKFSPNFQDRRRVYDFVTSTLDIRVVSERVRRIVLELAPDDVEFLPITLLNHHREVASRKHFIMNVLAQRDVIDLERSDIRMSAILKDEINGVDRLAIKQALAPTGPRVFRPIHLQVSTMIDATLHEALAGAGPTGCRFLPADGWDGEGA